MERYLRLVVTSCPPDRDCISMLLRFLALDTAILSPAASATPGSRRSMRSLSTDAMALTNVFRRSPSMTPVSETGDGDGPYRDRSPSAQASPVGGGGGVAIRSTPSGLGSALVGKVALPPALQTAHHHPTNIHAPVSHQSSYSRDLSALTPSGVMSWSPVTLGDSHATSSFLALTPVGLEEGAYTFPPTDELQRGLGQLKERVMDLEGAVQGAQLGVALHEAVVLEYTAVSKRENEALRAEVAALKQALHEEAHRAGRLEDQLLKATLAKDDALFAMTEVSAHSARKLMDAETRYMNLLRTANKRPPPAHSNGGGKTAVSTPSPGRSPARQPSGDQSATTPNQRKEQLATLLRQSSSSGSPGSSPFTRTARGGITGLVAKSPSPQKGGGKKSALDVQQEAEAMIAKLQTLVKVREEEGRAMRERLMMAAEETEGYQYALAETRRLASLEATQEEVAVESPPGPASSSEDPVKVMRSRLLKERVKCEALKRQVEGYRARWGKLQSEVEGVIGPSDPEREREGEGEQEESKGGGERTRMETKSLLRLVTGSENGELSPLFLRMASTRPLK